MMLLAPSQGTGFGGPCLEPPFRKYRVRPSLGYAFSVIYLGCLEVFFCCCFPEFAIAGFNCIPVYYFK